MVAIILLINMESDEAEPTNDNTQSVLKRSLVFCNANGKIQNLVTSHKLDVLAVCKSWIVGDDPDTVMFDAIPCGF